MGQGSTVIVIQGGGMVKWKQISGGLKVGVSFHKDDACSMSLIHSSPMRPDQLMVMTKVECDPM